MLQVEGVKHRIADVQQPFITGGDGYHHMTWRVSGCRDHADAGQNLALTIDKAQSVLNRFEFLTCDGNKPLRGF